MIAHALWRSETLRVVPWLCSFTCLRLLQGPQPRHKPACLWSTQCTGNHPNPFNKYQTNKTVLGIVHIHMFISVDWYWSNAHMMHRMVHKMILIQRIYLSLRWHPWHSGHVSMQMLLHAMSLSMPRTNSHSKDPSRSFRSLSQSMQAF